MQSRRGDANASQHCRVPYYVRIAYIEHIRVDHLNGNSAAFGYACFSHSRNNNHLLLHNSPILCVNVYTIHTYLCIYFSAIMVQIIFLLAYESKPNVSWIGIHTWALAHYAGKISWHRSTANWPLFWAIAWPVWYTAFGSVAAASRAAQQYLRYRSTLIGSCVSVCVCFCCR